MAAMTAKVARIVGFPTSATASTATSANGRPLLLREAEVANDVFDNDNCVVDQNANAENEREERNPVERVAKQIEDAEGKRQGDGNREQNNARFSPTEKDCDQKRDGESGEQTDA